MSSEAQTVLHTWSRPTEWNAPTIIGGTGARLQTADGRSILDMSSLSECSNLGHQHPRVVAAIRAQAERLCFVTSAWGAEPRARLAEMLLEKSGFEGGRVFFTLGGTDANEHAVKFARQASGRTLGLGHHASAFLSRLQLRGHGVLRGLTHRGPDGSGAAPRGARAPALRLPLPVSFAERARLRHRRG